MIQIAEHFLTQEQANSFILQLFLDFPPAVFGTKVVVQRDHYSGTWAVTGHRFDLKTAA